MGMEISDKVCPGGNEDILLFAHRAYLDTILAREFQERGGMTGMSKRNGYSQTEMCGLNIRSRSPSPSPSLRSWCRNSLSGWKREGYEDFDGMFEIVFEGFEYGDGKLDGFWKLVL